VLRSKTLALLIGSSRPPIGKLWCSASACDYLIRATSTLQHPGRPNSSWPMITNVFKRSGMCSSTAQLFLFTVTLSWAQSSALKVMSKAACPGWPNGGCSAATFCALPRLLLHTTSHVTSLVSV
jgi:hypothetical protein